MFGFRTGIVFGLLNMLLILLFGDAVLAYLGSALASAPPEANQLLASFATSSPMYWITFVGILALGSVLYWVAVGVMRDNVTYKYTRKYGEIVDLVINATIVSVVFMLVTTWGNIDFVSALSVLVAEMAIGYAVTWICLRGIFPMFKWKSPIG